MVPSNNPTPAVVKLKVLAKIGPSAGSPCCAVETANWAATAAVKIPRASRRNLSGATLAMCYRDASVCRDITIR